MPLQTISFTFYNILVFLHRKRDWTQIVSFKQSFKCDHFWTARTHFRTSEFASHARVLFTWSHLAPALQNCINGQYVPLFIRLNKRTNSMLNSLVQSVSFISNNFWSSWIFKKIKQQISLFLIILAMTRLKVLATLS